MQIPVPVIRLALAILALAFVALVFARRLQLLKRKWRERKNAESTLQRVREDMAELDKEYNRPSE